MTDDNTATLAALFGSAEEAPPEATNPSNADVLAALKDLSDKVSALPGRGAVTPQEAAVAMFEGLFGISTDASPEAASAAPVEGAAANAAAVREALANGASADDALKAGDVAQAKAENVPPKPNPGQGASVDIKAPTSLASALDDQFGAMLRMGNSQGDGFGTIK